VQKFDVSSLLNILFSDWTKRISRYRILCHSWSWRVHLAAWQICWNRRLRWYCGM